MVDLEEWTTNKAVSFAPVVAQGEVVTRARLLEHASLIRQDGPHTYTGQFRLATISQGVARIVARTTKLHYTVASLSRGRVYRHH